MSSIICVENLLGAGFVSCERVGADEEGICGNREVVCGVDNDDGEGSGGCEEVLDEDEEGSGGNEEVLDEEGIGGNREGFDDVDEDEEVNVGVERVDG
jgi:hypothetical protein